MIKEMTAVLRSATIRKLAGALTVATLALSAAPAMSHAAAPGQFCNTNSFGLLYFDANTVTGVPAGSLVKILGYQGPYHYRINWSWSVGWFERSRINQATCHYR